MIERAKSFVKAAALRAGFTIQRSDSTSTMDSALSRVAQWCSVATIIDIGASDGRWTVLTRDHFPRAQFHLIEAQDVHEPALRTLVSAHARISYVLAAAGDRPGRIHFDTSDPWGGAASASSFGDSDTMLAMTSVDVEVDRLDLHGPFLIKLDTHGFEREILTGASRTLEDTNVVVVEAYNFTLRPGALRFHELVTYLETLGFRPVDVVNVLRRPADHVLWQFDMVFARGEHPVFSSESYR